VSDISRENTRGSQETPRTSVDKVRSVRAAGSRECSTSKRAACHRPWQRNAGSIAIAKNLGPLVPALALCPPRPPTWLMTVPSTRARGERGGRRGRSSGSKTGTRTLIERVRRVRAPSMLVQCDRPRAMPGTLRKCRYLRQNDRQ
jgi:hypothetical protein